MTEVAKKQREAGTRDRARVLRNPIEILAAQPVILGCTRFDRYPGNSILGIHLERGEGIT